MITIIPKVEILEVEEKEINISAINIVGQISDFAKKEIEEFIIEKTAFKLSCSGYEIDFSLTCDEKNKEWYSIDMKDTKMSVVSFTEEGTYRAIQTIKQILSQKLFVLHIEDEPKNNFRAFMLDTGRYFYPVNDIKKIIDYIALYKVSYFLKSKEAKH